MIGPIFDAFVQLSPALVGFVALGGAFWTTTRQIRAATVSAGRQQWIDGLRGDLSQVIGMAAALQNMEPRKGMPEGFFTEFGVVRARIRLRLNSTNESHVALLSKLKQYEDVLFAPDVEDTDDEFVFARDELISTARYVFAREWLRIKVGR